jgi:hypothetical protein
MQFSLSVAILMLIPSPTDRVQGMGLLPSRTEVLIASKNQAQIIQYELLVLSQSLVG